MSQHHEHSIVVVENPTPRYSTGIMDQHGNLIIRSDRKNPIGFVWFDNETKTGMPIQD